MQRSRILGAVAGLLFLLSIVLSGCGAAPVAENWPGLTAADEAVYVISGAPQQVYVLNAETGVQQATFAPQGERKGVAYWSPVTAADGLAFVGFGESQTKVFGLYAFDPETGQEQWRIPAEELILSAPVYADGVVYFGSSDGRLYAVDVESQSIKPGWPFQAGDAIWGSPLVAEGRVYVAAMDHRLYSLDAESGQVVWSYQAGGAMAAQPTLVDGILYVGAFDGQVHAVRADSGQAVEGFQFQAENWIWSTVLAGDDYLYVTSLDGRLYALDPATGAVVPPYPYDSGEVSGASDVIRASPVQAGEFLIIATESGRVIAVKDGLRQWYWPSGTPESSVLTTPVVVGDVILVVQANGKVQTLQADSGVPGWTFSPLASE